MENSVYKPDIYEGGDPYIFVSFHQNDRERILNILEKLDMRGFRFWIDDGISPGMETDEIIAEHIERCDLFIAFLSGSYLDFLDKVDELNYSRDTNREYLLIYLEDVVLPAGLDMRFMRSQSIRAFSMSDEDVYSQLLNIDGAKRFYGITDTSLRSSAEKIFDDLEKLYPEHKVFALDAVAKQVSKGISELYVRAGYPSADRLMLDYGFAHISTDDARALRSSVLYQPGFEPDIIKPRIDYIVNTLAKDYPDKHISDNLAKSHKSIYKSVLGISVWLGYDSAEEMLRAYGFTGISSDAGRRETDCKAVIEQLKLRYEGKAKPASITGIIAENPDIKGNLKTAINRSSEIYGMTLHRYLTSIGLIVRPEKEKCTKLALDRVKIIEDIKELYRTPGLDYGSFEDAEGTLDQIIVKKNRKNEITVTGCSFCDETMRIPYGIDYIGNESFYAQGDLKTLIIPPSVKEIKESAFSDCDGLETVIFSEGLERIGNLAFSGCTSLKKLVLPHSLRDIGNEAFAGCEELSEVEFKNFRVNIQEDAFNDCLYELEYLQDEGASPADYFELNVDKKNNAKITAYTGDEEVVVIPAMIAGHPVISLEKGCFKGNEYVREIYISDYISAVNGDVFKDCKNLEKVHLSESVKSLTGTAFAGCTNLTEINIPDSMEEVQRGLFKDSPLTTLYVGKGTKKISSDAFYKGEADFATGMYFKKKSIENIIIDSSNPYLTVNGTALLSADQKTLIAELGDPVKAVIPEGVEEISPQAYDRLGSLCEIEFPSTLKKIGEKAFAGTNLKSVELPRSLEVIEAQAFSFCRVLSNLDVNEGLRIIGAQAFAGCPIEDVYIPASVESIGNDSFLAVSTYQGQISQKFRVDTANLYIIADGVALYERSGDTLKLIKAYHPDLRFMPNTQAPEPIEYSIIEGTTEISAQAFSRCNNLSGLVIPESVRIIGDMAFWDCSKLSEIHIPEGCVVSAKAFFGISPQMI